MTFEKPLHESISIYTGKKDSNVKYAMPTCKVSDASDNLAILENGQNIKIINVLNESHPVLLAQIDLFKSFLKNEQFSKIEKTYLNFSLEWTLEKDNPKLIIGTDNGIIGIFDMEGNLEGEIEVEGRIRKSGMVDISYFNKNELLCLSQCGYLVKLDLLTKLTKDLIYIGKYHKYIVN